MAKKYGLSQKHKDYLAETDMLLGFPIGTSEAQLYVESRFDNTAKSNRGAQGIAQFMPSTVKSLEDKTGRKFNPLDNDDALEMHRMLMSELAISHGGDVVNTLRAYNAGPQRDTARSRLAWASKENREYAPKIESILKERYNTDLSGAKQTEGIEMKKQYNNPLASNYSDKSLTKDDKNMYVNLNDNIPYADAGAIANKPAFDKFTNKPSKPLSQMTDKEFAAYMDSLKSIDDLPYTEYSDEPIMIKGVEGAVQLPAMDVDVNKSKKEDEKSLADKIRDALASMASRSPAQKTPVLDKSMITRDRTGLAMMLDNMNAAGGSPSSLMSNRGFTGESMQDQLSNLSQEEARQADMIGAGTRMKASAFNDLIGGQAKDREALRQLQYMSLQSLPDLAKLMTPTNSNSALMKLFPTVARLDPETAKKIQERLLSNQGINNGR